MAEGGGKKAKKVMVAVDESECSLLALEWVLANLRSAISSPSVVFTVQRFTNVGFLAAASYGESPTDLIQTLQRHQQQASLAVLEKAKQICARHGGFCREC